MMMIYAYMIPFTKDPKSLHILSTFWFPPFQEIGVAMFHNEFQDLNIMFLSKTINTSNNAFWGFGFYAI